MSIRDMSYQLHGFIIGKEIHFDVATGRMYRLPSTGANKNFIFGTISFNETMLQLFLYLLKNARNREVTKEELLKQVWEKNDLSSSSQRLWQVLNNLNKKLNALGLPNDFIRNIKGSGYIINYLDITPIYYRISDLLSNSEQTKETVKLVNILRDWVPSEFLALGKSCPGPFYKHLD